MIDNVRQRRSKTWCSSGAFGLANHVRKIHGKAGLKADQWARDVLAAQSAETQAQALPNLILPPDQRLELGLAQISILGISSINLGAERQSGVDPAQNGEPSSKNMSPRRVYPDYARAGVSGEQVPKIHVDPGLVRQRFLRNPIKPVI